MLARAEHSVVAVLPQLGLVKMSVLICLQERTACHSFGRCNCDTCSTENGKITMLLLYWGVLASVRVCTANAICLSGAGVCMLMVVFNLFFSKCDSYLHAEEFSIVIFFHVKLCPNIYCPYCRQAV